LAKQIGRFELADGSTIFLDEIGELPLELQAKLLRVLQDGAFERLGSPRTIHIDVRVIAATNRNLEEAVKKGTFREDLYYRLKVFPIEVPPLREHREDIPLLVHSFLNEFSGKLGNKIHIVPESTMEMLKQYQWPGNVRELRNVIEQAVIISDGNILQVNLPKSLSGSINEMVTLEKAERQHIIRALEKTGWRIKGRIGAAELLGLKPSTLYAKMEKLGIPTNRDKGRYID
jgi:transcriptional regulator with GAF, ATPase, and Fis domain